MSQQPQSSLEGSSITFRSLTVTIPNARSSSSSPSSVSSAARVILSSATGHIRGGFLCALLGASGSGKTTLLHCLAQRDGGGVRSGEVLIDGRLESAGYAALHCGFVPQQSVLLPALTPRETIAFASHMRLPAHTAERTHIDNVERIVTALNLGRCADSVVGDDIVGGLSGGEKRRTNVGVELVTRPSVLFLDEPTTGLDSHTALSMVQCLKGLTRVSPFPSSEMEQAGGKEAPPPRSADAPVTVVLSIHQPNHEVFSLFDDLVLLSGGLVLYCGPASEALLYFDSLGLACPLSTNPPEHFLDLAQSATAEERRTVHLLSRAHAHHAQHSLRISPSSPHVAPRPPVPGFVALPYGLQLLYLLRRAHLCVSRSPLLKIAQVLQSVVLGLLVGAAFYQLGYAQSSVQNRLGAVYFICLCLIFANTFAVVLTFTEERAVFMREQSARLYDVSAYFVARTAVDVLPTLACSLLFVLVAYWLMGLAAAWSQWAYFVLMVLLLAYTGQSIGLVVACAVPERLLAMVLTPLAIAPFIVFTPYALPYADSVPPYLLPLQYLSPFWWSFSGLVANEMTGLLFDCDAADQITVLGAQSGASLLPRICPYRKGRDVLDHFNIPSGPGALATCAWVLVVLAVGYRVVAFALLKALSRNLRPS